MTQLFNLANKFAMKLGLEAGGPTGAASLYEQESYNESPSEESEISEEIEDPEDPEDSKESLKYLNITDHDLNFYLRSISYNVNRIKENISLRDYDAVLNAIDHMQSRLKDLEFHVSALKFNSRSSY